MPDIFRDNRRLPDNSMDRYCFETRIGCERFNSGTYKTQADLDREREAAEALIPKVIVEIKGNLKWTFDEALEYLMEKAKRKGKQPSEWLEKKEDEEQQKEQREFGQLQKEVRKIKDEAATKKCKQQRKEKTIEEIYYATMAKAGKELPKPKPAKAEEEARFYEGRRDSLAERRNREREEKQREDKYRETLARRLRQKDAMDSGAEFSTRQQPYSAGVITWSDPLITDVRLVRLVLGADRGSREMTADEQSDYWYWKARGK